MWARPYWAAFWLLTQNLADWLGTLLYSKEPFSAFMMQPNAMNQRWDVWDSPMLSIVKLVRNWAVLSALTIPNNNISISSHSELFMFYTQIHHALLTQTHTCSNILFPRLLRRNTPQTAVTGQGSEESESEREPQKDRGRDCSEAVTYVPPLKKDEWSSRGWHSIVAGRQIQANMKQNVAAQHSVSVVIHKR